MVLGNCRKISRITRYPGRWSVCWFAHWFFNFIFIFFHFQLWRSILFSWWFRLIVMNL